MTSLARTALVPSGTAPSAAQRRWWLLDRLDARDPTLSLVGGVSLHGALDAEALRCALDGLLQRHACLRTGFRLDGSLLRATTRPAGPAALAVHDLRAQSPDARPAVAAALAREAAAYRFDVSAEDLARFTLIQTADDEHTLLWAVHRSAADEISLDVLTRDISRFYDGTPPTPPSPSRSRADAADPNRTADLRRTFGGMPPGLRFPEARARERTFRVSQTPVVIGSEAAGRLRARCAELGVRPATALRVAFAMVIARYTGQQDVLLGFSPDRRSQVDEIVEPCDALTLLPVAGAGAGAFDEIVCRAEESARAAEVLGTSSFDELMEVLSPARDLSHEPLAQVLVEIADEPAPAFALRGLTVTPVEPAYTYQRNDLVLRLGTDSEAFTGSLSCSIDLFDVATARDLAARFVHLVALVADEPSRCAADPEALPRAERERLLVEWNATEQSFGRSPVLHKLIEEQALRTPRALAVTLGEHSLTYEELNACAGRLADRLRSHGAGPDRLVGLCVERSLEMMVALLAILKAGAAYLPLDPDYPADRLQFMLEDSEPMLVVAQDHLADRVPGPVPIVSLTGAADLLADVPADPAPPPGDEVRPHHLAYVIYTSGSTGRPKGVMIAHEAVVDRLLWMQETYRLGEHDRVLQKNPISFDISVWELFWPLLAGAQVVLAEPDVHRDPAHIAALIQRAGVTVCQFVPSMFAAFLETAEAAACSSLRLVCCIGEALPAKLVRRHHEIFADCLLENHYGPTEATILATSWSSPAGWSGDRVPIGRPIANSQVYVLDERLRPVPTGAVGELYLGGVGLARGYLNRPELTAERFVRNPFGHPGAGRIYQTGDLVRYTGDGAIEYLGRVDHQIKLRGYRIELGEVTDALVRHPGVREAVVTVQDAPGDANDKRLIGYVVLHPGTTTTVRELRRSAGERLPEYMVPAAFVALKRLPLTANGKIDRAALPSPSRQRPAEDGDAAAATPAEALLRREWSRMLATGGSGRGDDFFALGGTSLQAAELVARIAATTGVDLPLRSVFETPTLGALASLLTAYQEQ